MKLMTKRKRNWALKAGILMLSLIWSSTAMAVDIQIGGGSKKLDLSRYKMVHQETFDSNRPPQQIFWGSLGVGQRANDPWMGMLTKGAFSLSHSGRPGSVRYYNQEWLDKSAGITLSEHAISMDVSGTMNGQIAGAGLMYAIDYKTNTYLAFILGDGRSYALYRRGQKGLHKIMGGTSNAVRPNQTNQLAIVPEGSKVTFYINGTSVATLKNEATTGGAGILAISSGMFLFDNFTLYKPSQTIAPPSRFHKKQQSPSYQESTSSRNYQPSQSSPTRGYDRKASTSSRNYEDTRPSSPQYNRSASKSSQRSDHTASTSSQNINRTASPQKQTQPMKSPKEMLKSYQKVLKVGMTKEQVIQMFGPPGYERGPLLIYNLGKRSTGVDYYELLIQLDGNNKVKKFEEVQG